MRFVLKHEIKGRMRLHAVQNRMSFAQADTLQYYLEQQDMIESVKVNERTCDVVITSTRQQGRRYFYSKEVFL